MTLTVRQAVAACAALSVCAVLLVPQAAQGLGPDGRITLVVFAAATCAWIGTSVDDTYIALGAATWAVALVSHFLLQPCPLVCEQRC